MEISPFQVHLGGIFHIFLVWEVFLFKYLQQLNGELIPFIFKGIFPVVLQCFGVIRDWETRKEDRELNKMEIDCNNIGSIGIISSKSMK